jgi:acetolactate synthase-1/2/3 large subunit
MPHGYTSRLLFLVHQPRTFLTPAFQGALGWGYATALGARVARPKSAVVTVSGDGGFMFNVQELGAASSTTSQ